MPAIRLPLRERRKVQLNVQTAIPTSIDDDYDLTLRGRNAKARIRTKSTKNPKRTVVADMAPRLHPIHTPTTKGMLGLYQLVPYIYVGCYEGAHLPRSLVSNDGALFTHIVKISHAQVGQGRGAGGRDLQIDLARGIYCLGLVVPGLQSKVNTSIEKGAKGLRLTEEQLLLTRDFLALALPYYREAHPRADIPSTSADSVRVLITAPAGTSAAVEDIMAVAVCYLAFASEERAETVLKYVDAEEGIPGAWKGALMDEGVVRLVQRVAELGE